MKLISVETVLPGISQIWHDDDSALLAGGDTDTLKHLLRCRELLQALVNNKNTPLHWTVLDTAARELEKYNETETTGR